MLLRSFLFTLVLLTLASTVVWGETVDHAWSLSFGGTLPENAAAVVTDDFGNIYATGYFQDGIWLGGDSLISAGNSDVILAKFAPDGSVIWTRTFGDAQVDNGIAMACDEYGYISLLGSFWGTIDLGGGPLASAGMTDMFVAKFAPDGTHIWSLSFGDSNDDTPGGIAIDDAGNVFFTGEFYGSLTLGGITLSSLGGKDIFLAKLDANGTNIWAKQFGGSGSEYGRSVTIDGVGDVILAAEGQSSMDFGGGILTPIGTDDIFLAKFDNDGNFQWAHNFGGAGSALVRQVTTDSSGNILLAAYAYPSADFGGGILPINYNLDVVLAKYDPSGNHIWSKSFGGTGFDYPYGFCLNDSDHIIVTGLFSTTVNFGGDDLVSHGEGDIFVAQFAADGTHEWSKGYGGSASDKGKSVAIDPFGNVMVAAQYKNAISVGTDVFVSNGHDDFLLIKYHLGPNMNAVQDVPGDQGGLVNVTWYANSGDNVIDQAITEYSVWRAIDAGAAMALIEEGAALIEDATKMKNIVKGQDVVRTAGAYFWYQVATVNALAFENYSAPVATLFDSTGATAAYHYFQVIAHTSDPYVYYTSDPDSGYSVDNLAPATPQGLAGQQVSPDDLELTWNTNSEEDLAHYEVYRGTDPEFAPDSGSLLGETPNTAFLDIGWSWDGGYWYKVIAVDTHGNKSSHASFGPDLVTDVNGSMPVVNRLDQNVPNPFNPTTSIEFALAEADDVTLRIYNANGQLVRTLVNGHRTANTYRVTWNGRDDRGQTVASGVYFYRLTSGVFTQTKKMVLLK